MSFETKLVSATPENIVLAGNLLNQGELVAIPTETVYGLAANAFDESAVGKIFVAKGRPQDNPLIVHIDTMDTLEKIANNVPETALRLAENFWPGPLTMVLPRANNISDTVSGGLDTVGIRMPAHSVARDIIQSAGVPLAAPSANLSGSPSPTTAAHVLEDMNGRIPLIVNGGDCLVGVESTVISLVEEPIVLRPGFITAKEIATVLQVPVKIDNAVVSPLQEGESPASPGMKYKHYAPKADIIILDGSFEQFLAYLENQPEAWALCFEEDIPKLSTPAVSYGKKNDSATQATALFSALRKLDEQGAKKVYARMPSQDGIGLAVYNRLLRAAGFKIKEL